MVISLAEARRQHKGSSYTSSPGPLIKLPTGHLGPMMRATRKNRGWSLLKLQQRGQLYRDIATLAKMEKGVMDIDYATLVMIARTLGDPALIEYANALILGTLQGPEVA